MKDRIRNPLEIVGDTALYCTTTGHIGALNMKDGSTIWDVEIGYDLITPPATDGDGIYIGTNNGRFLGLSFNSGQITWQKEIGSPIKAGATIFGDIVIFVGLNHKVYFVDKKDGTERSEFETRGMLSARPIVCSNRIYIVGEDKNLYCFQVAEE
jgi:outer membrane protein assembly factor BamB